MQGYWGHDSPENYKSRSSEMQFPTFWTSNRVAFMKIFIAIWRLFPVKTYSRCCCCFLLSETPNKLSAGALAKALTQSILLKQKEILIRPYGWRWTSGKRQTPDTTTKEAGSSKINWRLVGSIDVGALGPGSITSRANTQGLKITEQNVLPLFRICKWLDFLVFSDKDEQPYALSQSTFTVFTDLTVSVIRIRTH